MEARVIPPAPVKPQERLAEPVTEAERKFWLDVRQSRIMEIAAIERRLGHNPRVCPHCGERVR